MGVYPKSYLARDHFNQIITQTSFTDSSKDSSLQSDTSIESEDSFASVIYIPKKSDIISNNNKIPSVPTSPLIMPCPTPIHSPAPLATQRHFSSASEECTRFIFDTPKLLEKHNEHELKKPSTTLQVTSMQTNISTIITPPTPTFQTSGKSDGPSLSTRSMPRVTREAVRDLPPIPKFRKPSSGFPIVRRITSSNSNVIVPKLSSLEIFNPETDDLDSESSDEEPSSPDSIDSVINALQSGSTPTEPLLSNMENTNTSTEIAGTTNEHAQEIISNNSNNNCNVQQSPLIKAAAIVANKLEDTVEMVLQETTSVPPASNIIINKNDINLNVKITNQHHFNNSIHTNNFNSNNVNNNHSYETTTIGDNSSDKTSDCREHLVEFAEKLSAQLLKELDNETFNDASDGQFVSDSFTECNETDDDPYVRKINGDIKSLSLLRDELRERRLLLANLGTSQPRDDVELHNNFSCTPPMTIQELEEDDSPPLSAKIQSHLSQNSNLISNLGTPPQAVKKQQQKINDYILEENEENEEDESSKADDSSSRSRISFSLSYNACNNNCNSTHDTALLLQEDSFEENDNSSSFGLQQMKQNLLKSIKYPSKLNDSNNNSNTNSVDSWANSNTASLDSPSVGGGSATHHVFHHVFREGELDALINKHVSNLHIVSSYYERASWCVVCEKVQVWTI